MCTGIGSYGISVIRITSSTVVCKSILTVVQCSDANQHQSTSLAPLSDDGIPRASKFVLCKVLDKTQLVDVKGEPYDISYLAAGLVQDDMICFLAPPIRAIPDGPQHLHHILDAPVLYAHTEKC